MKPENERRESQWRQDVVSQIFTDSMVKKVLYAYIAVSVGHTGIGAVQANRPDLVESKIIAVEKRLERMEVLIIDLIKGK